MANKTIFNKGRRAIVDGNVRLEPNAAVKLKEARADKLLGLFPNELIDPAKAQEQFEDAEDASEELADLTVPEIKELLEDNGVEFESNAKKAELVELASQL